MNNHYETDSQASSGWQCIDPVVGSCLWELEVEDTADERSQQLRAHLELCDACRLDVSLNERLEQGLQAGELVLPQVRDRVWWLRSSVQAGAGSALIAACLALLMILPPAPSGDAVSMRGGLDEPHFLRPVEGEVVIPENTVMSWAPIDGATSYQVTLSDVGGDFQWVGSTSSTQLELPLLDKDQQTLRAVLTTVPSDLVSPGLVSVLFSTGTRVQLAQDRLLKAPAWLNALLTGGCFLLGMSVLNRQRRMRTT
jgi:hypothetical protein